MRERYDASSKWLIETCADSILKLAGITGVESWVAVASELVQSRQLPDGLVEVKLAGRDEPVLFLFEINTYPEKRLEEELLEDLLMTYLNRGVVPEIVTIVLCQRGLVSIPATASRTSPNGGTSFQARWQVIEIWTMPAESLLPITDPGLAPWLTLMDYRGPAQVLLQQCRDVVESTTTGSQQENLMSVLRVLASLRYDETVLEAIFRKGEVMIESPYLNRLMSEREMKVRRSVIVEILAKRFGELPVDISAGIQTVSSLEKLAALNEASWSAASLDEFQSTLHATL